MMWAFGVCCVGLVDPGRDQFSFSLLLLAVLSEGASEADPADHRPQRLRRKTDSRGDLFRLVGAHVLSHRTPHLVGELVVETR
jgi:hypothetical protein